MQEASAAYEKARTYSEKATEKERLWIEASYAGDVEGNSEKHDSLIDEIVNKYPRDKAAQRVLANRLRAAGQFDKAIKQYELVLELDPNDPWALNSLGSMYARIGNYEKAVGVLKRCAASRPGDVNPLDSLAEVYFLWGKLDESIAKYGEVIKLNPDFFASYFGLAHVLAFKGDYSQAISYLDQCILRAQAPRWKWNGHMIKGLYYYWLGALARAKSEFENVRRIEKK